jgi:glutaredoxin
MQTNEVVMITAPWCGACKAVKSLLLREMSNRDLGLTVLDMVEQESECAEYNPTALPTIIYKGQRISGNVDPVALRAMLSL